MMIRALGALLLATAAFPGLAAEGGAIRGGEHDGFTRIVLDVDPTTEWSLETGPGTATLRFPGRPVSFGTGEAFDRIPRTRVRDITATRQGNATIVSLALGCDCRVTASFVGARYLALDIADRDGAVAGAGRAAAPQPMPEAPEARATREAEAVATAEDLLIRQIERAAGQGLIDLAPSGEPAAEPATESAAGQLASAHPPPPPAPVHGGPSPAPVHGGPPPAPAHGAMPQAPASPHGVAATHPAAPAEAASKEAAPADVKSLVARLSSHEQIDAVTVYDRDRPRAKAAAAAAPEVCLPDDRFDVARWASELPMADQLPPLRRQLIGEFDAPDVHGITALAEFYIRFGFGAEAEALLAGFGGAVPADERALLVDMARTVEGRPLPGDGPLSLAETCPGRHGLWQALAPGNPPFRDAAQFAAVQNGFAELPTDLRAQVGPPLASRLVDEGQLDAARVIYETAIRPGDASTAALDLVGAQLAAAEGRPEEAARAMAALAQSDTPTSQAALEALVPVAIGLGVAPPDYLITDLRAAALRNRGSADEAKLRGLLVEALAAANALPAAIAEVRSAIADIPTEAPRFAALAVRSLADADPETVGASVYARTVLEAQDLVATAAPRDPDRKVIADRLVALGLPAPAVAIVDPALAYGDRPARLAVARAEIGLSRGAEARATLGTLTGPEATDLRARAFVLTGDYADAVATLADRGLTGEATPYAWPSGDWALSRDSAPADSARWAMASYMLARTGSAPAPEPAPDPAALDAAAAFREPLPALDRPTLSAARRLIASGPKVSDVIEDALKSD